MNDAGRLKPHPEVERTLEQAQAYLRQHLVEAGCRFEEAEPEHG